MTSVTIIVMLILIIVITITVIKIIAVVNMGHITTVHVVHYCDYCYEVCYSAHLSFSHLHWWPICLACTILHEQATECSQTGPTDSANVYAALPFETQGEGKTGVHDLIVLQDPALRCLKHMLQHVFEQCRGPTLAGRIGEKATYLIMTWSPRFNVFDTHAAACELSRRKRMAGRICEKAAYLVTLSVHNLIVFKQPLAQVKVVWLHLRHMQPWLRWLISQVQSASIESVQFNSFKLCWYCQEHFTFTTAVCTFHLGQLLWTGYYQAVVLQSICFTASGGQRSMTPPAAHATLIKMIDFRN